MMPNASSNSITANTAKEKTTGSIPKPLVFPNFGASSFTLYTTPFFPLRITINSGRSKKVEIEDGLCGERVWAVAASVGAVEALKDQGFCRWNYTMRSIQRQAKNNLGSFYQAWKLTSSSSSAIGSSRGRDEKGKQSEESFRTVMYLSHWGPN